MKGFSVNLFKLILSSIQWLKFFSISGLGTNDAELIRIIVSRSEIDLEDIKRKFFYFFNQKLSDFIKVT